MSKAQISFILFLTLLLPLSAKAPFSRAGEPQGAESFCSKLNSIVRAGRDNFRSIRGTPDPDSGGEGWSSTISLPGAQECLVWATEGGPGVNCDFQEATSASELENAYSRFVNQIANCLQGWSKTPEGQRKRLIKGTEFEHSPMTVRVELVQKTSRRHPGYELTVWIDKNTEAD